MNTYHQKVILTPEIKNKTKVRDFILEQMNVCGYYYESKIVGLAGPNINEYLDWCSSHGFINPVIYENDNDVFLHQIKQLKKPVTLINGNINNVDPNLDNTFYDLDYCSTIIPLFNKIDKFNKNYCMTFSLRPIGENETLKIFFKIMGETVYNITYTDKKSKVRGTYFSTIKGRYTKEEKQSKYLYISYKDSSPMCCIAKIK